MEDYTYLLSRVKKMAGALKRIPSSEEIQSSLQSKGVSVRLSTCQKLHTDVEQHWKKEGRAEVVNKPRAKADTKEYSTQVVTPPPAKRSVSFGR